MGTWRSPEIKWIDLDFTLDELQEEAEAFLLDLDCEALADAAGKINNITSRQENIPPALPAAELPERNFEPPETWDPLAPNE